MLIKFRDGSSAIIKATKDTTKCSIPVPSSLGDNFIINEINGELYNLEDENIIQLIEDDSNIVLKGVDGFANKFI